MRILIISGIWPPEVGGPASYGPELGRFLAGRGHELAAVVSADGPLEDPGFPLRIIRRDRPLAVRMPLGTARLAAAVRGHDAVYATGMYHRSAAACAVARVPLVMKLVNDPAYERARNRGWFPGTLESFQGTTGGVRLHALRAARHRAVVRASALITPSAYLGRIVERWGVGLPPVQVVPNPAVVRPDETSREALRRELGFDGPTAVFAGRLVLQKDIPTLVAAMQQVSGLRLCLVGDGPERDRLAALVAEAGLTDVVRLEPRKSQAEVSRWMRAADFTVLPSSWENFPHAVVESLASGTPVVATAVGGVPEILTDGVDGWLVPPGDASAFGAAMRRAIEAAPRMREAAAANGGRYRPDRLFAEAERIIVAVGASRVR